MRKVLLLVLSMLLLVMPALAQDEMPTIGQFIIGSAIAENPEFTMLVEVMKAADPAVLEPLGDPDAQLTLFAPTDAAFNTLKESAGEELFNAILTNPEIATKLLLFHIADGKADLTDIGVTLDISIESGPEGAMGGFSLRSLQGEYIDIAQAPDGIIVNGANLIAELSDVEASNGFIHVIDAVITPENRTIAELVVAAASAETGAQFTTLLAALQAADPSVLNALSSPEAAVTVFAPTDAAFAALGEETLNAVLADPAWLSNILLYHVVPGVVRSGDLNALLENEMSVDVETAFDGELVMFEVDENGVVTINGVKINTYNIDAANGVIHAIDAVLLPPSE